MYSRGGLYIALEGNVCDRAYNLDHPSPHFNDAKVARFLLLPYSRGGLYIALEGI